MIIGDEHKKDSRLNAGATPQGNQNTSQLQDAANEQVLVNPPDLTDSKVWAALLQMAQAITTRAQAITAQANREVAPRENPHASTMVSRLRDFTRMNPPMYFGSKVDEDTQDFLDNVYKILFFMGVSTTQKAELTAYQLKDVAQTWYNHFNDSRALGGSLMTWEIF